MFGGQRLLEQVVAGDEIAEQDRAAQGEMHLVDAPAGPRGGAGGRGLSLGRAAGLRP